jgi:hypothetical protein
MGSGALHALSGPDHLLSLGPLAVRAPRGAWRLGLLWGLGHGVASAAAAALLVLLASAAPLEVVDAWAERVAGAALAGMGIAGLVGARRARGGSRAPSTPSATGVLAVGALHGVTGAAGLLLLLPAVTAAGAHRLLYVAGFGLGSTLAMAALTGLFAAVARSPAARPLAARIPLAAAAIAIVAGAAWMIAGG